MATHGAQRALRERARLPSITLPGSAWDYAATHRVEALPGGVTVINLNDHCAIAFLWVLPMFGCSLGKIPARGDLFDHMHEEAESGAAR